MDSRPATAAIELIIDHWTGLVAAEAMSPQTLEAFRLLSIRFGKYLQASSIATLNGVDPDLVNAFVRAPGRDRSGALALPSVATMHMRRAGIRLAFRTGRALGLTAADPARDITLSTRSTFAFRPVTEDEAALLRDFSAFSLRPTRHAAAVALALAGVHTGELGHITVADINLADRSVSAHGAAKADERTLPLDTWATHTIRDRIRLIEERAPQSPAALLVSSAEGTDAHRHARTCVALRDVIQRAGLGGEGDLRPSSLTAYAGAAEFARSGRLETAATLLGLRSLDRTATMIGYHWQRSDS